MLSSMEPRRGDRAPPTRVQASPFLRHCVAVFSTNKTIGPLLPLPRCHPPLPLIVQLPLVFLPEAAGVPIQRQTARVRGIFFFYAAFAPLASSSGCNVMRLLFCVAFRRFRFNLGAIKMESGLLQTAGSINYGMLFWCSPSLIAVIDRRGAASPTVGPDIRYIDPLSCLLEE